MSETYHWIKIEDYKKFQKGADVKSACGEQVVRGMRFCTSGNLPVINCENCKNKYNEFEQSKTQKLCSFCSTPLRDEDCENSNDFYLSCFQHKRLAKIETEKFFQENPTDYTKWAAKLSI